MKHLIRFFFFFTIIIGYSQAVPSFNSVGLKLFLDTSVTNNDLKLEITEFINTQQIGILTNNEPLSNLSLAFNGTNYTLTKLPQKQIIYKISNSKPSKTEQLIKEKISQFAYGFRIKNLSLKNTSYAFKFRIKPVEYENYEVGNDIPTEDYPKTDGLLNFNTYSSAAILEVTNLSENPIYFSIIEINSRGELSSFIPNFNCALIGIERRLEPHQTISIESCLFNFGPPYETLTLKGFASAEPINFEPIIKNKDNSSLDYVKNNYTEMFTYQFAYNIIDKDGNMPYEAEVDYYKPKTSSELETVISELSSIESTKGKLTKDYISSLNEVSSLHQDLGNNLEAYEYKREAAKLAMQLKQNEFSTSKLTTSKTKQKAMEEAMRFAKMTDSEKVAFLQKENSVKRTEIQNLKTQIDSLTIQLEKLKTNRTADSNTQMRGSKASNKETNPLSNFTYRALIIAEQDYVDDAIKDLKFPIDDANKLKTILSSNYAFDNANIIFLENPTRNEIFKELHSIYEISSPTDHLLIFYAGHGVYDEGFKRGYWLPSDAVLNNKGTWMSNLDIKDYITNIKTKHTLLISDACFSGSIFEYNRDVTIDQTSLIVKKLLTKNGRNAMTSGLDKPVPDQSIFIKYLLKTLSENEKGYLKASDLFNTIQEVVLSNTDNIPQYGVIKNANHEGGEFIFLKRE